MSVTNKELSMEIPAIWGSVIVHEDAGKITLVELSGKQPGVSEHSNGCRSSMLEKAKLQISAYLSGELTQFDLPLDWDRIKTGFSREVIKATAEIPYGKTMTYGMVAKRIGKSSSSRAVGQALKRNPFPILIPCHRVLAGNGFGGFSCGLEIKNHLLELEGILQSGVRNQE